MILAIAVCLVSRPLQLESEWAAPNQLPFERVHSVVKVAGDLYIGGLKGLVRGSPGKWQQIDDRSVRRVAALGDSVWVLFGDGSIDKIEPKQDRLVFDVLKGRVKRPWASSINTDESQVQIGLLGGWVQVDAKTEERYLPELDKQTIFTMHKTPTGNLWVGTQRKGLFSIGPKGVKRYGFAAGLSDSWVTGVTSISDKLYAGLADGGLVVKTGEKFVELDSPCRKVRFLTSFRGRLVVGGMEGCWVQSEGGWQELAQGETTCISLVDGKLIVGSPTGIKWWG